MYAFPGTIDIKSSSVTNGNTDNGLIFVSGDKSNLKVYDSVFTNNKATRIGSFLCSLGNEKGKIHVEKSKISKNSAQSSLMKLSFS